jgi:hypothetical protein
MHEGGHSHLGDGGTAVIKPDGDGAPAMVYPDGNG